MPLRPGAGGGQDGGDLGNGEGVVAGPAPDLVGNAGDMGAGRDILLPVRPAESVAQGCEVAVDGFRAAAGSDAAVDEAVAEV